MNMVDVLRRYFNDDDDDDDVSSSDGVSSSPKVPPQRKEFPYPLRDLASSLAARQSGTSVRVLWTPTMKMMEQHRAPSSGNQGLKWGDKNEDKVKYRTKGWSISVSADHGALDREILNYERWIAERKETADSLDMIDSHHSRWLHNKKRSVLEEKRLQYLLKRKARCKLTPDESIVRSGVKDPERDLEVKHSTQRNSFSNETPITKRKASKSGISLDNSNINNYNVAVTKKNVTATSEPDRGSMKKSPSELNTVSPAPELHDLQVEKSVEKEDIAVNWSDDSSLDSNSNLDESCTGTTEFSRDFMNDGIGTSLSVSPREERGSLPIECNAVSEKNIQLHNSELDRESENNRNLSLNSRSKKSPSVSPYSGGNSTTSRPGSIFSLNSLATGGRRGTITGNKSRRRPSIIRRLYECPDVDRMFPTKSKVLKRNTDDLCHCLDAIGNGSLNADPAIMKRALLNPADINIRRCLEALPNGSPGMNLLKMSAPPSSVFRSRRNPASSVRQLSAQLSQQDDAMSQRANMSSRSETQSNSGSEIKDAATPTRQLDRRMLHKYIRPKHDSDNEGEDDIPVDPLLYQSKPQLSVANRKGSGNRNAKGSAIGGREASPMSILESRRTIRSKVECWMSTERYNELLKGVRRRSRRTEQRRREPGVTWTGKDEHIRICPPSVDANAQSSGPFVSRRDRVQCKPAGSEAVFVGTTTVDRRCRTVPAPKRNFCGISDSHYFQKSNAIRIR